MAATRVLIVDDDELDRMQLRRSLNKSDVLVEITEVETSAEALKVINQQEFDCCFFDYLLPGKDGIQLVQSVRKLGILTPIIVVTSQTDPELSRKSIEAGANNYITKSLISPDGVSLILRNSIHLQKIEEELRDAKENALALAEAKQSFLANMSHEIRTPMNAIIGFSKLLIDEKLNTTQADYAQSIYSSAENLLIIINDILDFSKIESGKLSIERINFSLKQVLNDITKVLQNLAKTKGLYLKLNYSDEIAEFFVGDPYRINQIMLNLVSNSIKFTMEGGVTLQVNQKKSSKSISEITIDVVDTGIGISKENQSKVFQSFSQAEGSTTRKFGGTGLGLTISRQLAELMGGEITLISEQGKGSTFSLNLPLYKVEDELVAEMKVKLDSRANTHVNQFSGSRVLLVDDNEVNRKLALIHLSKLGCEYDIATNGKEALEKAGNNDYDLIFMDIQMPIMDGIESTKRILKLKKVNIIGMSAHVLSEEIERCMSIGMVDYLTKPFKPEDLYDLCSKYLNKTGEISGAGESGKMQTKNSDMSNTVPDVYTNGATLDHLDIDFLKQTISSDENVIKQVFAAFKNMANEYIDNVDLALQAEDFDVIFGCSHKMAPGSQMLGFNNIYKLLCENETLAKNKDNIDLVTANHKFIRSTFVNLLKEVETFVE